MGNKPLPSCLNSQIWALRIVGRLENEGTTSMATIDESVLSCILLID